MPKFPCPACGKTWPNTFSMRKCMVRVPAPKRADLCNVMFNLTFIYLLYQSIISSEIFLIFLSVSFFFWGWFPANVYDYHAGLWSNAAIWGVHCNRKGERGRTSGVFGRTCCLRGEENNGKKSVIEEGVLRVRVALRRHSLNAQCPHLPLMTSYTYIIQTHLFRTLIYFFLF